MENKDVEVIKFDLGYFITSQGLPPSPPPKKKTSDDVIFTKFPYTDSPLSKTTWKAKLKQLAEEVDKPISNEQGWEHDRNTGATNDSKSFFRNDS